MTTTTQYSAALAKLCAMRGPASDLANAGRFPEAAALLLKMGITGDFWRACREAAGLPFDSGAYDAEMAELMAARKRRFSK